MPSYTSPKTTRAIVVTDEWTTILTGIPVVGDNGEPIDVKFYGNVSGLLGAGVAWPFGPSMDIRILRNSKVEGQTGFDETGLDTKNPNPRYRDRDTGRPFWKQYIAHSWPFAKNCTTVAVQLRAYNSDRVLVKEGAFIGTTDHDQ